MLCVGDDDVLGKFLIDSTEFYSRLPDILESKLDFRLSQLTTNQASFTSKTHLRMVQEAMVLGLGLGLGLFPSRIINDRGGPWE